MSPYISVALACLVATVTSYKNGAPVDTVPTICNSMKPNHTVGPSTTDVPYEIVLSNTCYNDNQKIAVTVREKAGQNMEIEGLFLQIRKTVGNIKTNNALGGEFLPLAEVENVGTYKCPASSSTGNAYGHKGGEIEKHSTSVQWLAPAESVHGKADLAFVATVVRHEDKFWTFVQSETIKYMTGCVENTTLPEPHPQPPPPSPPTGAAPGVDLPQSVLIISHIILFVIRL